MTRDGLFLPYGFFEARVGTSGEDLYEMSNNPQLWNIGLGAGIDIFATDSWGFYLELGFLGYIYKEDFIPSQRFEFGTQFHF